MTPPRTFFQVVRIAMMPLAFLPACTPGIYESRIVSENVLDVTVGERQRNRIQSFELRTVRGSTALDAVRQLRPDFLHSEPPRTLHSEPAQPSVYLDARYAGGLEMLATVPLGVVVEIQRMTSVGAKSVFGSYCKCDGGVMLVRTRVEP